MILAIRTDQPDAELYLFDGVADQNPKSVQWYAHRQLADTIFDQIQILAGDDSVWQNIDGIVVYRGPGSFTGLRIGVSVANSLASASSCAIVGTDGDDWLKFGLKRLYSGQNDQIVMPFYGAEAHITPQKK